MQNNFQKIKQALADADMDAILITSDANRFYAAGFESTDGVALVTQDDAYFFTDSRYIEAAEKNIKGAHVSMCGSGCSYVKLLNSVIVEKGIKKLGFEDEKVTFSAYSHWRDGLRAELLPSQKLLSSLRAVKSREELGIMKKAQTIAEKSFNEILPLISTDITEKELADELMYRFLKNGASDKSFDTIAVSAEHSSMPHGVPSNQKIKKGFLTLDFGVIFSGYCSDTTRTVCVGKPTDEMRQIYDTVLQAQLAGIERARAGVSGRQVDAAAREVISRAGYGEFFGHSFGHSLGIEIHEEPNASPVNENPLPAGAVISAEPGIYLPGKFGVRIEDVLFLTSQGNENITNLKKELIIL